MDRKGNFRNELTETSSNCITKTLAAVKQILLEAQEDCQHVSPEQQVTGRNQPCSKFKGILLILKEILTQTRNNPDTRHSGFTLPAFIETRTCELDLKISSVSYGFFKNLLENLEDCDDLDLLKRHVLNKSMEYMVGLFDSMKHQLVSFQPGLKARGKHVVLDVESYELLLYLVVCLRQLKEDLKQRTEELSAMIACRQEMFAMSAESRKLILIENKKKELIKELTCDLGCCYDYLNNLDPEIAIVFEMLIKELEPSRIGVE